MITRVYDLLNGGKNNLYRCLFAAMAWKKTTHEKTLVSPWSQRSALTISFSFIILIFTLTLLIGPLPGMLAAAPSAGTLAPAGGTQTWTGSALGGSSANEATCVEGVSCDTYTLTVSGSPTDWTGKVIAVKIAWTVPAHDYDLYIHKD
jgi:hypothetical protein